MLVLACSTSWVKGRAMNVHEPVGDKETRDGGSAPLRTLSNTDRVATATLEPPSSTGFRLLAARLDHRRGFLTSRRQKRDLLRGNVDAASALSSTPEMVDVAVFSRLLTPPGGSDPGGRHFGTRRPFHPDVVVLAETVDLAAARGLAGQGAWQRMVSAVRDRSAAHVDLVAANVRRMGAVDHDRDGVFLFNFFAADDRDQCLAVWQHTAGWFQQETRLDNSTVLLPEDDDRFAIVNHCRWDGLADILPSIVLKPSFRSFVLRHFEANATTPVPVLYRRVALQPG